MNLEQRQDPKGGPAYNQFDQVRLNHSWRSRVEKEAACSRSSAPSGFQMNLANVNASGGFLHLKYSHNRMETVTEKEIKQSPQARMSMQQMEPDSLPVMAIKHMSKGPTSKWDLPMTASQESGWLLSNPVRSGTLQPEPFGLSRKRGVLPGTMAVVEGRSVSVAPPLKPLSVTMPANHQVLERVKSAPNLPQGPTMEELRSINGRKWYRPKGSSDVTQYANAYHVLMHHSPFSRQAATG